MFLSTKFRPELIPSFPSAARGAIKKLKMLTNNFKMMCFWVDCDPDQACRVRGRGGRRSRQGRRGPGGEPARRRLLQEPLG